MEAETIAASLVQKAEQVDGEGKANIPPHPYRLNGFRF